MFRKIFKHEFFIYKYIYLQLVFSKTFFSRSTFMLTFYDLKTIHLLLQITIISDWHVNIVFYSLYFSRLLKQL